jgi:hypothetical protein
MLNVLLLIVLLSCQKISFLYWHPIELGPTFYFYAYPDPNLGPPPSLKRGQVNNWSTKYS